MVPRHTWEFTRRFRRGGYGWSASKRAAQRVNEATDEILRVARGDTIAAAEGVVRLVERISPAFEHVDDSSGRLGNTIHGTIAELAPIVGEAPVADATRQKWLERLWQAFEEDEMPWIESLGDHWGVLCGSPQVAGRWADRLLPETRRSLRPNARRFYKGASPCLASLLGAERHDELYRLVENEKFWLYRSYGVDALLAMGRTSDALAFAEAGRSERRDRNGVRVRDMYDVEIDAKCEEILNASGRHDEAYSRYGLNNLHGTTALARFRDLARRYPHKDKLDVLRDLINATPDHEGTWFATAHHLGQLDLAIEIARRSPCDPRTLNRAAEKQLNAHPQFAHDAAMASLHWMCANRFYSITDRDVRQSRDLALKAAEKLGKKQETERLIAELRPQVPACNRRST